MFNCRSLVLATVVGVAFVGNALATIIVDTLPSNDQATLNAQAGQTFTTGVLGAQDRLSTIEIAGPSSGAITTIQFVELWSGPANKDDWTLTSLLGTSTNSSALPNNSTKTFNFSKELLSDNTFYALRFVDGGGTPQGARVGMRGPGDPLPTGQAFSGGAVTFSNNFDMAFRVTTAVIPEPTTLLIWSLLAGLGLALGWRRRK